MCVYISVYILIYATPVIPAHKHTIAPDLHCSLPTF